MKELYADASIVDLLIDDDDETPCLRIELSCSNTSTSSVGSVSAKNTPMSETSALGIDAEVQEFDSFIDGEIRMSPTALNTTIPYTPSLNLLIVEIISLNTTSSLFNFFQITILRSLFLNIAILHFSL